jgi:hypothetical protein
MANHPSGQAIGVEFEIDDSLLSSGDAYLQSCSLYTSAKGDRRIRLILLCYIIILLEFTH